MNQKVFASCLLLSLVASRPAFSKASDGVASDARQRSARASAEQSKVIDLCQVPAPTRGGIGFSQQRLVLFDLGGRAMTDAPESQKDEKGNVLPGVEHRVFQQVGLHDHLRNVFFGTFPMERFHTVAASVAAPSSLAGKQAISHAEMIRAAELDPFAGYSIACADWVMFPRISKKSATWQQVTRELTENGRSIKYQSWALDTEFELSLDLYRFEDKQWALVRNVTVDPGLIGLSAQLNSAGDQINQLVTSLGGDSEEGARPGALSAAPELTCRVPLLNELEEIADSYGKCGEATLAVTSSARQALEANPLTEPESEGKDSEAPKGKSEADSSEENESDAKDSEQPEEGDASKEPSTEPSDEAELEGDATEEHEEPVLDDAVRGALEVARSDNPRRSIQDLAKQELSERAPEGMLEVVGAARTAASTCGASVDAVVKASERLRALASKAPAELAKQAVLGFAGCAGVPLTYDLGQATPPGTEQMRSEFCRDLDRRSAVSRGFDAMRDVALCTGRMSLEHTTLAARTAVIATPGIKIEVPLQALNPPQSSRFGLAVGKTEGARRGDMYLARASDGSLLGFGFIVHQGLGKHGTRHDLSHYRFRMGEAPLGTNMEEYPKVGFLLGARPQVALILRKQDALVSTSLLGGALEAGYNAGQFVPVGDEFWVRTNFAYLVGQERERFLVIEFVPEAQYYLFNRFAAFVQSGVGMTFGDKTLPGAIPEQDLQLDGYAAAFLLGAGLDVAVTPDWNARLAVTGSQGLTELTLEDKQQLTTVEAGRLSTVQGTVSVDYSF